MEDISLKNDTGGTVNFQGRLFAEQSFYDEENDTLTQMKLYTTDDKRHVYSISSGKDAARTRRFYSLQMENELCNISNGHQELSIAPDMLFTVVHALCGLTADTAEELRAEIDKNIQTVNG